MSVDDGERSPRLTGKILMRGGGEGVGNEARGTTGVEHGDVEGEGIGLNEKNTSSLFHGQIRFHHLAAATGLIVTYVIEIIVQIFLAFYCYPPAVILVTSGWWNWSSFLAVSFLLSSLVVTIVSIVWVCRGLDFAGRLCGRLLCYVMHSLLLGLLWRYLKLTFVYDRADVQEFVALRTFQAYFQSLPLTSIHLAWLISSHENWSSVSLGMISMEFACIITALMLSSYVKSDDQLAQQNKQQENQQQQQQQQQCIKSKSNVMEIIVKNFKCSASHDHHQQHFQQQQPDQKLEKKTMKTGEKGGEGFGGEGISFWSQLLETKLTVLGRALLLCSRIIVVGIIIVHLKYWTCMFVLVHLTVSIAWIIFTVNNSSGSNNHSPPSPSSMSGSALGRNALLEHMDQVSLSRGKDYVTVMTEWTYVLFWDVMSLPGTVNLCTWILPVLLVLLENGIVVLLNWHAVGEDRAVVTIISGTCLLLGWLLFSSLTLVHTYTHWSSGHHEHGDESRRNDSGKVCNCCCSPLPVNKDVKTGISSKDKSQQTQVSSVIDPMIKYPTTNSNHSFFSGKSSLVPSASLKCNDNKVSSSASSSPSASFPPLGISALSLHEHPAAFPNTYTRINEKLLTRAKTTETDKLASRNSHNGRRLKEPSPEAHLVQCMSNKASSAQFGEPIKTSNLIINHSQHRQDTPATTWVSDTCCNDSNGSSNSRNTNTLRDNGSHIPDLDETDLDSSKFIFYFPTDTSGHQSLTSYSPPKCDPSYSSNCNCTPLTSHEHHHAQHDRSNLVENKLSVGRRAKKKSRSSSISSFRNVRHYRISSPVEIKKAARIPVYGVRLNSKSNNDSSETSTGVIDCHQWDGDKSGQIKDYPNSHYEKLIEDSYGILICESEPSQDNPVVASAVYNDIVDTPSSNHHVFNGSKKLRVLCAKCLGNHDPLLSNCLESFRGGSNKQSHLLLSHAPPGNRGGRTVVSSILNPSTASLPRTPPVVLDERNSNAEETGGVDEENAYDINDSDDPLPSDTTEYPSETEMTCTLEADQLSVSTNLSTATYTTWPHQSQPNLSMWTTSTMMPQSRFPKEFTSLEYVRTWLLTSQARLRHQRSQNNHLSSHSHYHHHHPHHHNHQEPASLCHQLHHPSHEARSRLAKKVYRSHTLAAQSRKVRFVNSVITRDSRRSHLDKRHVTAEFTSSPSCPPHHHTLTRRSSNPCSPSLSLSFQPPPRQKQHPTLPPRSVIPHQKPMHRVQTSNNHNIGPNYNNTMDKNEYAKSSIKLNPTAQVRQEEDVDLFHKDLEIIL